MSELLSAAARALNAPEAIVQRSAEARAKAGGVSVDEVLTAWSGGVAVSPAAPPAAATAPPDEEEPSPATPPPAGETLAAAVPVAPGAPAATAEATVAMAEAPPATAEAVAPAPLGERARAAGRIGAIAGAVLGLVAAVAASPFFLPLASVAGTEGSYRPAVEVGTGGLTAGVVLFSLVFGLIIAALARTVPGWLHPGMRLAGKAGSTRLLGAGMGIVLGFIAAAVLAGAVGAPVEGAEGVVSLPVIATLVVVVFGGAMLGWITGAAVQVMGVPQAMEPAGDAAAVRHRLGSAISVPVAGILALVLLVVPLGVILIRSNHLAKGGAAIIAVLVAASILALSGLSASRPGMRITRAEFLVALAGIGVVVTIIVSVLLARSEPHAETPPDATSAAAVLGAG
jgi:hypothetical protein